MGDILAQETIPIDANATVVPLTEQLATVGSNLLVKCISNLDFYLERCVPQPEEGVSLGAWVQPSIFNIFPQVPLDIQLDSIAILVFSL